MARGKSIFPPTGKRDAMDVAQDRPAIRAGLVDQALDTVWQQRRGCGDQQGMIARASQRFASASSRQPASRRKD
jgi:hypothetical protein